MPIENRNLAAGTRLVARHKKQDVVCEVVRTDDGIAYRTGGREYGSPSSAGRAVTGGVAVNGWRFWSLDGTLKERSTKVPTPARNRRATAATVTATKGAKKSAKRRAKKSAPKAARAEYGCGLCSDTFSTMKEATKHALAHTA